MINSYSLLKIYKSSPFPSLMLLPIAPRFEILEVTASFATAIGKKETDIIGKGILEVFSGNKEVRFSSSDFNLSNSLKKVIEGKIQDKGSDKNIFLNQKGKGYYDFENIPVFNDAGEIEYIIHTVTNFSPDEPEDKTLKNWKEDALQSQLDLNLVESLTKTGSWKLDLETKKLTWSDEFYKMCGYVPQSFEPTPELYIEQIHPEDREKTEVAYRKAIEKGEVFRIDNRILLPDERVIYCKVCGTVITDREGNAKNLVGLIEDITKFKLLENELEESVMSLQKRNEFIEKVLQNIPIGIAVNKINNGKAVFVNKYFSDTYGWEGAELSDVLSFFEKIYPEETYRKEITDKILSDIKSGIPERMTWENVEITASDGGKRVVNAKNIPLPDQNVMISTVIDVTKATSQTRELLRKKSNEEALVNSTGDLMWSIDKNYKIITANEAFRQMLRLETGQEANEGDYLLVDSHGDSVNEKWRAYYHRALTGEKFTIREDNFSVRKKEMEHLLISFTPMHDLEGKIWGIACYSKDITEETQNLIALESAKEELHKIMDSSLDIICTIDADGKFISLSAASKAMLGYSPEELVGKYFIEFVYPDDRRVTLQAADDIMAGVDMTNFENRYIRKDGTIIPLVWSVRWDKNDALMYCIAKDATEKKRSELEMRLMIHNTDESFILIDKALKIVAFNEQFDKIYRRHYNLEVKKGSSILDYAQPERKTIAQAIFEKVLKGSEETIELSIPLPDKSSRTFLVRYKPAIDEQDNIIGVFMTFKDITEANFSKVQLEASEAKYRLLFHKSPLPKWIYDLASYRILEVNESAIKHYGYSRQEFCALTIKDLRSKKEVPKLLDLHRNIRKNEVNYFGIHDHTKKDKSKIKVEVSGNIMEYMGRDCMMVDINDVTEREKALQKLRDNEEKLLNAQKIAKLGYWQLQIEGDNLYWSDEVFNIWGVQRKEFKVSFESFLKAVHPDDKAPFLAQQNEVLKGNGDLDFVHRIILSDGSEKWVHEKGKLICDDRGQALFLEGTVQDITARKLLELSLDESYNRYKYVTKASFDAIWDWDLTSDEIYLGDGFQEMFGYDVKSMNAHSNAWKDQIHPEDYQRVTEELDSVVKGDMVNWINEYRYQKSDKNYAYVLDRGYVIRDKFGKAVRMVGAMQDITKKKEEEYHLKLLESVITNTNDAILILKGGTIEKDEYRIVFVNEANMKMMGYDAREAIGQVPKIISCQTERVRQEQIKNALKSKKPWEITSLININNDASWINAAFSPIINEHDEVTHWILIERDVTMQKNEELQKELIAETSSLFAQGISLHLTLEKVLQRLVTFGEFCLAEAWLIGSDQKNINLVSMISESKESKKFYQESEHYKSFKKGQGLPGSTWELGRMQSWSKVSKNRKFVRKEASEKAGIDVVWSLPLLYNTEVIGVIVLGVNKVRIGDKRLILLFERLCNHLSLEIKRKQLEQDLTQIFSFTPDIICIAGTDGFLRKINPAMCNLMEYSEEELLAIPFRNFIHPDDKEITAKEIYNLSIGKSTHYFENRLICKSGKIKWLAWTATPAKEEPLFFSVAKDITEKKNLEQLLDKANHLAKIGSWEFDLRNNSLYWSSITKEIHEVETNFNPDSKSAISFYKEGSGSKAIKTAMETAMNEGVGWDLELPIITGKGNERWVRTIGEVEILNGEIIRLYGSFQDIDEQKKAADEIRLSNERYSVVSKATNDSIWDWDLIKNEVVRPGRTLESLLGYGDVEPELVDSFWKNHVHKQDWDRLTKQRNALLKNVNENYWEDEYQFLKADGQYAAIYDRGYILRDEKGKAIRMIGASRDISKLKENEFQLKAMNRQLEKHAKELAISNAELEQFAHIASHDLQEPLRMITSFLTQIEKKYGSMLDERGKQYIHFAVDGAGRMRQIILDLLEFSRVGLLEETLKEVNMNEIVEETISLYRKQIKETNAIIEFSNLPTINSYTSPIRQVIQNLVSNALKYHRKGIPPHIVISFVDRINYWEFSIKDNGIGIDDEYFNRIFVIFQRLHNKDEYSGTGIGLAIVKKIVETLGGEIRITSKEGKGSVFTFTIAKHLKA